MILFDQPNDEDGTSPAAASWLPPVTQQLLARHGASVLDPATAPVAPGWPTPGPTVYRTATLLVPPAVLVDPFDDKNTFAGTLKDIGLRMVFPDTPEYRDDAGRNFTPAALVSLAPHPDFHELVTIDAWLALQHLRMAATDRRVNAELVAGTSLEHLYFSGVRIGGTPWDSNDEHGGPFSQSGRSGRVPVSVAAVPPNPREFPPGVYRRPMVAVLDSGIGPHRWFGISDRDAAPPVGGFVHVMEDVQNRITDLPTKQTRLMLAKPGYWDYPINSNPLVGDVDACTGHGTFITGIIRQIAPDANVLMIRVLHSDGVAYEGDVLIALGALVDRVTRAQERGPAEDMIDVVSLSIGYYDESPQPGQRTLVDSPLIAAYLEKLTALGVLVVAAAGNDSTSRPFYPAALAADAPVVDGGPQVISVGALNPNDTKAMFSNDGSWVRSWATGAGIVSTFPTDVRGAFRGSIVPDLHRETLDGDDYKSGFAVWDGTSFAAPRVAAALAQVLFNAAVDGAGSPLSDISRNTMIDRANGALERLRNMENTP